MIPLLPLAALSALAAPTQASPLEVTSRVMVEQAVTNLDGTNTVRLVAPAKVVPGDRVTFVLAYRNRGTQPIANLLLANPLPAGIAYRAPAAGAPAPELSVDGRSFGTLAGLTATAPDGSTRPATLDDVRAVRWRLSAPLAAGGAGELRFQALVK